MIYTTAMLRDKYANYANQLAKIKWETDRGNLIRLNRGLYESDPHVEPCLLASCLLSPSYLSFDFALSYYGLIPERVFSITSASFGQRKHKTYVNHFGRFEYEDIPQEAFSEGLTYLKRGDVWVKIATKEKAICDSLYHWPVVRSQKELKELLFEDKRIDPEEFFSCNKQEMIRLASLYHKTNLSLLLRFVEKEDFHE